MLRIMAIQFHSDPCKLQPRSVSPHLLPTKIRASSPSSPPTTITRRRYLSLFTITSFFSGLGLSSSNYSWSKPSISDFAELPNSGGVKSLDLRTGDGVENPAIGDKVIIHYYGRLAAKQGWRFDSTYDHRDENGEPIPFEFVLGSGKAFNIVSMLGEGKIPHRIYFPALCFRTSGDMGMALQYNYARCLGHLAVLIPLCDVISGIESAVRSMKVGGIRRVVIPPSQGYQNTSQEPLPPNFFDRQRLFTTIFNPTRMANGEGSTLGTLVFDIELVSLRHQ